MGIKKFLSTCEINFSSKNSVMVKKKQFGFGIVGAGTISAIHAMAIKAIEHATLIGIYSLNKSKADDFASKNNCVAYDTLVALLNVPEIDIICICTPSGIHLEPALKCIAAGKHCLIEKPLEVTVEKCDRIIEAAAKAGVMIGVVFPSRFYETSQQVKKAIDENRFGVSFSCAVYGKNRRPFDGPSLSIEIQKKSYSASSIKMAKKCVYTTQASTR